MEKALIAQLFASAAVKSLVGEALTWDERDEGGLLPAGVLQLTTRTPHSTLEGRTNVWVARVQIDCWGSSGPQADELADALLAAAEALAAPFTQPALLLDRRRDSFRTAAPGTGRSTKLNRTSLDVRVWFSEA